MFKFVITYEDEKQLEYQHITSVSYASASSRVDVAEDTMLTHVLPIGKALWLRAEGHNYCVSGNGMRTIEISAE